MTEVWLQVVSTARRGWPGRFKEGVILTPSYVHPQTSPAMTKKRRLKTHVEQVQEPHGEAEAEGGGDRGFLPLAPGQELDRQQPEPAGEMEGQQRHQRGLGQLDQRPLGPDEE